MKSVLTLLFLATLISCGPDPDPVDALDALVGQYSGVFRTFNEDLTPVPVFDLVLIPADLVKSRKAPDAFTLTIAGQTINCTTLRSSRSGFSFEIPAQPWAGDHQISGMNLVVMDSTIHHGAIFLAQGRIQLFVRDQRLDGSAVVLGFDGRRP